MATVVGATVAGGAVGGGELWIVVGVGPAGGAGVVTGAGGVVPAAPDPDDPEVGRLGGGSVAGAPGLGVLEFPPPATGWPGTGWPGTGWVAGGSPATPLGGATGRPDGST